ncbi:type VII secretion target [Saccharomonospora sp. NPDC046836]|uniref:type VII secretion target n=1 Tax=Saccharomonospora sp. NPDC046836 TaxID=3156921 RepID=UPI0033CC3330
MAGGHEVEPAELRGYAGLLERQGQHFSAIEQHARDKGGDTSGFTGLLAILVPVVNGVVGLYASTLQFAQGKITEVKQNLETAAEQYEARDEASRAEMDRLGSAVDAVSQPTVGGS